MYIVRWTPAEDDKLCALVNAQQVDHHRRGSKWAIIAAGMPGRTQEDCIEVRTLCNYTNIFHYVCMQVAFPSPTPSSVAAPKHDEEETVGFASIVTEITTQVLDLAGIALVVLRALPLLSVLILAVHQQPQLQLKHHATARPTWCRDCQSARIEEL